MTIDGGFGPATQAAFHNITYGQTGVMAYLLQGLLYVNGYEANGFDGSYGAGGGTGCLNAVKLMKADRGWSVSNGTITEYMMRVLLQLASWNEKGGD